MKLVLIHRGLSVVVAEAVLVNFQHVDLTLDAHSHVVEAYDASILTTPRTARVTPPGPLRGLVNRLRLPRAPARRAQ